jgi:hypothetical protein
VRFPQSPKWKFKNMTISQLGLISDVMGFIIIFFTGGFTFGLIKYMEDPEKRWVLPIRVLGFLLVIAGFILQFIGLH